MKAQGINWAATGKIATYLFLVTGQPQVAIWRSTGRLIDVPYLSTGGALTALAIALFLWHNGLGTLWRKLADARGGSWAPWCGWKEYRRQVGPATLAALVIMLIWAIGKAAGL